MQARQVSHKTSIFGLCKKTEKMSSKKPFVTPNSIFFTRNTKIICSSTKQLCEYVECRDVRPKHFAKIL
uniref:Uncharacterized protein n=1 Tax=Triticum urartu TaxID=4572 RepID=A0A8R7PFZ5_TRIUA